MKPLTIAGLLFVLLGILGFATGGVIIKHPHTDIATSNLYIGHERRTLIPLSPYVSTIALVAGLGMLIAANRIR